MTSSEPGAEQWIGRIIGRYRVVLPIGSGGIAHVFLAEDIHSQPVRQTALKVLRPERVSNREMRQRFEREARAAARIRHPNVLAVGALQVLDEGMMYFPMEHLQGLDLADTLTYETRLSAERAVGIAGRMATGLGASHQAGVVHRDVKPENVFLVHAADGTTKVKILDFGFAWMEGDPGTVRNGRITSNLSAVGTPEYMAPEQVDGLPGRPVADVYSLGVVLFEMLTGAVPFVGASFAEIAYRHMNEPVPRPRELCPELEMSDALEDVVMLALKKDVGDRLPSMIHMVDALRATPEGRRPQPK